MLFMYACVNVCIYLCLCVSFGDVGDDDDDDDGLKNKTSLHNQVQKE